MQLELLQAQQPGQQCRHSFLKTIAYSSVTYDRFLNGESRAAPLGALFSN